MKLVIDEKLKHRLVGLSVILSLGAIFLPTMIKKSTQHLEGNFSIHVKIPPKPEAPKVEVTGEKELFKTIKVAQIKAPLVAMQRTSELSKEDFIPSVRVANNTDSSLVKTDSISHTHADNSSIKLALSNTAKNVIKKHTVATVIQSTSGSDVKIKQIKKSNETKKSTRSFSKNEIYAIQLASFLKLNNAKALVNTLHEKGHKANYVKIRTKNGFIYKVYAGYSPTRSEAMKLKTQLASAMQLNGFVVKTGGSDAVSMG